MQRASRASSVASSARSRTHSAASSTAPAPVSQGRHPSPRAGHPAAVKSGQPNNSALPRVAQLATRHATPKAAKRAFQPHGNRPDSAAAPHHQQGDHSLIPLITSYKVFRAAVEKQVKLLKPDVAWEQRAGALSSIASLCSRLRIRKRHLQEDAERVLPGADATGKRVLPEEFAVTAKELLRHSIAEQLPDLRSAVVKEACACVTSLCEAMPSVQWHTMNDWFIVPLLNASHSTVSVIATAAQSALDTICRRGLFNRTCIHHFTSVGCSSRHVAQRTIAYQHLCTVVMCCSDHAAVSRVWPLLAPFVRDGLTDAAEAVRMWSRRLFWALESHSSEEAGELYEGLEPLVQERLDDAREAYTTLAAALTSVEHSPMGTGTDRPAGVDEEDGPPPTSSAPEPPAAASGTALPTNSQRVALTSRTPTKADGHSSQPLQPAAATATAMTPNAAANRSRMLHLRHSNNKTLASPAELYLHEQQQHTDPISSEERWIQMVKETQSTDWSIRIRGLRWLQQALEEDSQVFKNKVAPRTAEALEILQFRLGDPHYRVAQTAAECFEVALHRWTGPLLEELTKFFPVLFANLSHTKPSLRSASRQLLHAIAQAYDADVLLNPIYRVLDVSQHKVKVAVLEFILFLIQQCPERFSATVTLRAAIGRLMLHHGRDKTHADVVKAIAAALAALYQASNGQFVRCVVALPQTDQLSLFLALEGLVPQLAQDCKRFATGERLLRHPAVEVPSPFQKALESDHQGPLRSSPPPPPQQQQQQQARRLMKQTDSSPTVVSHYGKSEPTPPQQQQSGAPPKDGEGGEATRRLFDRSSPTQRKGTKHSDPTLLAGQNSAVASDKKAPQQQQQSPSPAKRSTGMDARIYAAVSEHRVAPDLVLLLRRSVDSVQKRSAVAAATQAASSNTRVWLEFFAELLPFMVAFAVDHDHHVRVGALQCLTSVVQQEDLEPSCSRALPLILSTIMKGLDDPFAEVQREAAVSFHVICSGRFFQTPIILRSLLGCLKERHAVSQSSFTVVEELGSIVWRHVQEVPHGKLPQDVIDEVVTALIALFGHELSEMRKTVVGAFVLLWASLGDALLPLVRPLSSSQKRLISIYFQRHCVEHGLLSAQDPPKDLQREIEVKLGSA